MRSVARAFALVSAIVLGASAVPTTSGASVPIVTADLEGTPIGIAEVSSYYCHDLDYPKIHCYENSTALEAAVSSIESDRAALSGDAAAGLQYVKLFDLTGYAGQFIILSINYDNLSTIGWNDKVSSFIGVNNLSFGLWNDPYQSGYGLIRCCNQRAASLSATYDNQFSSTELR
jgi:hypothetical protein